MFREQQIADMIMKIKMRGKFKYKRKKRSGALQQKVKAQKRLPGTKKFNIDEK